MREMRRGARFEERRGIEVPAVWRLLPGAVFALATPLHAAAQSPVPVGPQFQVNTYTTSFQQRPSVAADADGDFVVVWDVWDGIGSAGTDTSAQSVQGQRYASDGTPQGGQFQVNTYTTS